MAKRKRERLARNGGGQVNIISAGAGSGKTTRIAGVIADAIAAREARPEAIVATTFTNRAADELEERVRSALVQKGLTAEAHRLAAARIGTVNSVCGRLVGEFAFELGLSPDLGVLDQAAGEEAVRCSISAVLDPQREDLLAELSERFDRLELTADAHKVMDLARANGIGPERLAECARKSTEGFLGLLGQPGSEGEDEINARLLAALRAFLDQVGRNGDDTVKTGECIERSRRARWRLENGLTPAWKDWAALSKAEAAKASDEIFRPVREAAQAHDRHPRLRSDATAAIALAFGTAAEALDAYARHKKARGVLDFIDQEVLALGLLKDPQVRARLASQIDLFIVDEFQDTSPIQLAVFLEIARLARKSVWVGDQKQAIYAFRGTDPALMDAAIENLLGSAEPEILAVSHRSRAPLVHLTSGLFARAFAGQGIPAARVRLEPASPTDGKGLGPVLSLWRLDYQARKNQTLDHRALAAALRTFLASGARVRDRRTGKSREVRPGDVAVLCRVNQTALELAAALSGLGMRAVVAGPGLLGTVESRLILDGIRRWIDPDDTLAAAELARIVAWPADDGRWLQSVIDGSFKEGPLLLAVREAAARRPTLGILGIFDAVIEVLDLAERCLAWGRSGERRGNVEALRALVAKYLESPPSGGSPTPAGVVSWLENLAEDGLDYQGSTQDERAVVVSTWHGAKGLEWPVVVLYELGKFEPRGTGLGVRVVAEDRNPDLADPLRDRWIRYWPCPYHAMQTGMPFLERLARHPATAAVEESERRENLRLFYTGWTRARDRVVLAARDVRFTEGAIGYLGLDPDELLAIESASAPCRLTLAGTTVAVDVLRAGPEDAGTVEPEPDEGHFAQGPRPHAPARIRPSMLAMPQGQPEGRAGTGGSAPGAGSEAIRIGNRIPITGAPDMDRLGEAVHTFLAADRPTLGAGARQELGRSVLARWGVAAAIRPEDLVLASDALVNWAAGRYPGARWRREWALYHRLHSGSLVAGKADLLLDLEPAFILLDHKTFPGNVEESMKRARTFTGQLTAYSNAVTAATGRPVLDRYVHLPLVGILVPLAGGDR